MNIIKRTLLLTTFLSQISFSQIIETDSFDDIYAQLDRASATTIVVFGCEDVIMRKEDPIPENFGELLLDNLKQTYQDESPEFLEKRKNKLFNIVLETIKKKPLYPEMPKLIADLGKKRIKRILLHCQSDYDVSKKVSELNDLGFDLQNGWPGSPINYRSEFGNTCHFQNGVIVYPKNKGIALKTFLKNMFFNRKNIIAIDKTLEDLVPIKIVAETFKLQFTGICYKKDDTDSHSVLQNATLKFRLKYLIENNKWIDIKSALDAMQKHD